ncbi:MAG: N-acetyl-gamma-glutamyl-phosphate reductase [Thermoguttaceae bacterium]
MIKIAILGATGYTALELLKILERHPHAEIVAVTSREDTRTLGEVHPYFAGRSSLVLENLSPAEVAARVGRGGCVFSCLPHCASARVAPALLDAGVKVIDLSADYRLHSPAVFKEWYHEDHPDAARLGQVPYGLPELFRDEIRSASLVANPGCYPTTAILALTPFLAANVIEPRGIVIDSKSGVSGAGRQPKMVSLYGECNESISAYGIGTHRHTPEISQFLSMSAGGDVDIVFSPHLTPMDRGILSTIYATLRTPMVTPFTTSSAINLLRKRYASEPFVQIVDHFPATKEVSHTNNCHITARVVGERLVLCSVIDNLVKGASGAAVQNMNLVFGFDETLALVP